MAMRKSGEDTRFIGDPFGMGTNLGGGNDNPIGHMFGVGGDGPPQPGGVYDQLPEGFADLIQSGGDETSGGLGTTTKGRDLFGGQQANVAPPPLTGMEPKEEPMGLPQGVSVNDAFASYGSQASPQQTQGQATPMPPNEPTPVAAQPPNPSLAQVERGAPSMGGMEGPRRRSVSSQMFGQGYSPSLRGRAGGLMGGGLGATGAGEPSGPIAPTEMMRKLLQLFQQQG